MGSTDSTDPVRGKFLSTLSFYELKLILDLFCKIKCIIMFVFEHFFPTSRFPYFSQGKTKISWLCNITTMFFLEINKIKFELNITVMPLLL